MRFISVDLSIAGGKTAVRRGGNSSTSNSNKVIFPQPRCKYSPSNNEVHMPRCQNCCGNTFVHRGASLAPASPIRLSFLSLDVSIAQVIKRRLKYCQGNTQVHDEANLARRCPRLLSFLSLDAPRQPSAARQAPSVVAPPTTH